jgi:hypothetical protein
LNRDEKEEEVLIAFATKSAAFWDVTPYILVEVYRYFGGTYCLHLHGTRVSQASRRYERGLHIENNCAGFNVLTACDCEGNYLVACRTL